MSTRGQSMVITDYHSEDQTVDLQFVRYLNSDAYWEGQGENAVNQLQSITSADLEKLIANNGDVKLFYSHLPLYQILRGPDDYNKHMDYVFIRNMSSSSIDIPINKDNITWPYAKPASEVLTGTYTLYPEAIGVFVGFECIPAYDYRIPFRYRHSLDTIQYALLGAYDELTEYRKQLTRLADNISNLRQSISDSKAEIESALPAYLKGLIYSDKEEYEKQYGD